MESPTCDRGGILVYKRKRKSSSPEADGDRLKKKVEIDKSEMEQRHGRAPTCDVQIGSTIVQETPKEDKDDKLLVLREVLQEPMEEEVAKTKQNNDGEFNEEQQLAPVYTPSGLAMKEKYAMLRKRQKGRIQLRNAGKGPRQFGAKQSSSPEICKRKSANAPSSSLMSLKGKGIITGPNAALPNKVTLNVSASGLQSSTRALLRKKPAGFLKRNTKPNDWSELELDALWVGVRRYGQYNWERILTDPCGYIFKNRTPQDLSTKWNSELLKTLPFPQPTRSSIFPAISLTINNASSQYLRATSTSHQGPFKGSLFPCRPEFPRIKDNKDRPIIVLDSDSEQDSSEERSEATLSA